MRHRFGARLTPRALMTVDEFDASVAPSLAAMNLLDLRPVAGLPRDKFELALHPAAPPVAIERVGGVVTITADTGTAGPGYHDLVCRWVEAWAASLDATVEVVDDVGDYYERRDRGPLEAAGLAWLAQAAADVGELLDRGMRDIALCLPEGTAFRPLGPVHTPMGPRDRAWIERVAADPKQGVDFFAAWENEGTHGYDLGHALAAMWIDVRWRKPIDQLERRTLDEVLRRLELAHGRAPEQPYPWRAWSEIFQLVGEESLRATRAHMRAEASPRETLGYRRAPVRLTLSGGWSLEIPGELRDRWDERDTFVAWDNHRTLWFNSMTAPEGYDTEQTLAGLPELQGTTDVLAMTRGPLRGAVRFGLDPEDPQGRRQIAEAHCVIGREAAVATFVVESEAERSFVLECWGTLEHPDAFAKDGADPGSSSLPT